MPSKSITFLIVALLHLNHEVLAQLSPGDLASAHANLEGLLNCTKCHDLGKGVSETKCLDCHTELKARIDQRKGYHVSPEVAEATCVSCHNDHHGRNFDIIRFDEDRFDHTMTGYTLQGAHLEQDCRSCHKKAYISDPEIKAKKYTFLGLETQCLLCHSDSHQGTLSTDCASCHDFQAFSPASFFDHSRTDFPLHGSHVEIDCESCHPKVEKEGTDYQEFTGVEFSNCTSCHEDEHNNRLGQNCVECHTEESWHVFKGMNNFNHNKTQFPLVGQHRRTNCFACHQDGTTSTSPFKEYVAWQSFDCNNCHDDAHDSRLGTDCRSCHDERSFQRLIAKNSFDHNLTSYPLEGMHAEVDCRACHVASKVESLSYNQCNNCHEDYHQGEFTIGQAHADCSQCHSVSGFSESSYGIEQHSASIFLLEGAHLATPCFACHKTEDEWHFRNIGNQCSDCHQDIHEDILDEKLYPNKACDNCHQVDYWSTVTFDHDQTDFQLEGKHLLERCNSCHLVAESNNEYQKFAGLSSVCVDCHADVHQQQFEVEGLTDCARCHAFDNWEATRFDHNTTSFKLEGEHLEISCAACHSATVNGELKYTVFQIENFECVDCHL